MATHRQCLTFLFWALGLASGAAAQSQHVFGMRIDWNAWNFKPMYDDSSGTAHLTGFLALAKDDAVSGDNIVAVWYLRNSDGSWSKKSWLTNDITEAIKSVKLSTGIPDSEDENWEAGQDLRILPAEDPENPTDYSKGLLATSTPSLRPVMTPRPLSPC
jgi:hypothetical protein